MERSFFKHYGSHWKFVVIMKWLSDKGYIIKEGPRGSRAPYRINTEKISLDRKGKVSIVVS